MKRLYLILVPLAFLLNGCLTYKSIEYRISFNERFDQGTVTVHYKDISSSEEEVKKRESDFNDLIELLFEEEFLLDNVEEGIYVKDRKLWEENGKLHATFSGIFSELKVDGEALKVQNEERVLFLKNEGTKIESDGKVFESEKNIVIVWPKDQREISWKLIEDDVESTHSLLDFYNKWKEEKEAK